MARQRPRFVTIDGRRYERQTVRTHHVTAADDIVEVIDRHTTPVRRPGDWLTVSEKVVAVTQGRAIPESQIKIGLLARLLWRHVRQVPYGIGLRSPSSMQCAINECGRLRILAASAVGFLGKLVGRRGDFYRIAGMQAATIDAAHTSPLQPDCVILGPKDPEKVAAAIKDRTGCEAAVMDINDIGGSWVLAATDGIDRRLLENIMRDNPCGQKDEQTPIAIVRRAETGEDESRA
jgi:F420-0:gamma-glutamyl ligase-like protein